MQTFQLTLTTQRLHQEKGKPASKGGKKSEAALIPDEEEPAPKKEVIIYLRGIVNGLETRADV